MASSRQSSSMGLQSMKGLSTIQPLGPSMPGGTHSNIPSNSLTITDARTKTRKERARSNESYDSDSSAEVKSPDKWPRNAMEILKSRMRSVTSTKPSESLDKAFLGSLWETTKKESVVEPTTRVSKRKSKRHCSLDAKTARFYAKRDTGWTPLGRKGSTSSSDDEGGFKRMRERSPRRKRGSRESSSLNSRTPSRDPSVVSPSTRTPSSRIELPPSSTGVVRPYAVTNITKVEHDKPTTGQSKAFQMLQTRRRESQASASSRTHNTEEFAPIPSIRVTNENGGYALPNVKPSTSVSPDISPLEEWLNSRPLSKSSETASTHSLLTGSSSFHNLSTSSYHPSSGSGCPLRHAQSHMEISSISQIRPMSSAPSEATSLPKPIAVRPTNLPVRSPSSLHRHPPTEPQSAIQPTGSHIQVNGISRSSSSTWNHPKSRLSLPAGMNSNALNLIARTEAPHLEPSLNSETSSYDNRQSERHGYPLSPSSPKSPVRSPVAPSQTSRHGLLLSSARSTEFLPIGGHVSADSKFLHNALRISNTASQLLNETGSMSLLPSQPGKPLDSPTENTSSPVVPRWSSDWHLHQSSSRPGIYRPIRSESMSHRDRNRLDVPFRRVPLSGPDSRQLEQALEELDEFYESLSTKSEDATLKSSLNVRTDSGVSSPRHLPEEPSSSKAEHEKTSLLPTKDREEYTKQWIHDERHTRQSTTSNQPDSVRHVPVSQPVLRDLTSSTQTLSQQYMPADLPINREQTVSSLPVKNSGSPWARLPRRTSTDLGAKNSTEKSITKSMTLDNLNKEQQSGKGSSDVGQSGRKDDFKAYRKAVNRGSSSVTNQLPNTSYLLVSFLHTPTIFTGADLEFTNYPGTKKPQPHIEIDDASVRKILQAQNTPQYRVNVDVSKQSPSYRNDYAKIETVEKKQAVVKPSKKPDVVVDDAAFRMLRSDQKDQKSRPQTLDVASKPLSKSRVISNSIRNLARHFESKSDIPKTDSKQTHAVVQINGQKLATRSPYIPPYKAQTRQGSQESPKISPMDDKQLDDLLRGLTSVSSSHDVLSEKLRRLPDVHNFSNLSSLTKRMGLQTGAKTAVSF